MHVDLIHFPPNTDHVCQSDVEEHSSCQGKDPVGGEAVAGQDAKAHAQVTATSRQEVKEQSLLYAHASIEEDNKVSWEQKRRKNDKEKKTYHRINRNKDSKTSHTKYTNENHLDE